MKKVIAVVMTILLTLTVGTVTLPNAKVSAADNDVNNGDWNSPKVTLTNTPEAEMMVRVGRINNFGYGWYDEDGRSMNPFSGKETRVHATDFNPAWDGSDPEGINRIMVVSGYKGYYLCDGSNGANDGYVARVWNDWGYNKKVSPVTLNYDTSNVDVKNASFQVFIDDIQPDKFVQRPNGSWYNTGRGGFSPHSYNKYTVTLNGVEIPEFEDVINNLDEHGPVGEIVNLNVPNQYLNLIKNGKAELKIDDTREWVTDIYGRSIPNTGDGYAINFVKLLINKKNDTYCANVSGHVYEGYYDASGNLVKTTTPVSGASVLVSGIAKPVVTGSDGRYSCNNVPAGQVVIVATHDDVVTTDKDGNTITDKYTKGTYTINNLQAEQNVSGCDIYLIKTESKTKPPAPPAPAAREER